MRLNPTSIFRRLVALSLLLSVLGLGLPVFAWGITFQVVTFGENDNLSDNAYASQTESGPTALTLFSALSPTLSDSGYTFVDWNTAPNGSGTSYSDGAQYSFATNLTLYAQWTANAVATPPATPAVASQYTVSYVDDGGVGAVGPVTVSVGGSVQLPPSSAVTYTGYTLTGWYTAATGGVFVGGSGITIIPPSSLVLYAQWKANVAATISFSANAGIGSVAPASAIVSSTITLPTEGTLLNPGYTFEGWSTSPTSQGSIYAGGASYVVTGGLTLYALWTATPNVSHQSVLVGSIGPFAPRSSVLGPTLKSQVQRIARGMENKGYVAASLFGYSLANETPKDSTSLSAKRAQAVVAYLRAQLVDLHVKAVAISSSGEGAVNGTTASLYRRVEVFLKL